MIKARLVETIGVANILGEGVLWRASDETLWWTDIHAKKLFHLHWRSHRVTSFDLPERLCSFGFVAGRDDLLIAAFESGFAILKPESAGVYWLARPAELGDGVRLNDGRVDPFGRFWAGAMVERDLRDNETPHARLYMLDGEGKSHIRAGGVHISNGLCWSPSGDRVYYSDSMRNEIRSARFNRDGKDALSFQRFAKTRKGSPDGAVTDCEGRYWSALWGGSRVACFTPAGEEVYTLPIDAPQPTCPAFGGPKGNLLFVTSARDGLSEAALAASPTSGAVFVFETSTAGVPAVRADISPAVMAAAKFAQ